MNRYRGVNIPEPAGEEQPISVHHDQLDIGVRADLKARQLPPGSSPNMLDVRFERGGIRKDFGERFLGQAALSRVLNLVEHKFIDEGIDFDNPDVLEGEYPLAQFHRLLRLFRGVGNVATTEEWNASTGLWEPDAVSEVEIEERYVRAVSVQNVLLYAVGGAPILIRREAAETNDVVQAFPTNSLFNPGDSTQIVFDSTEVIFGNQFEVIFNASVTMWDPATITIVVAVEVGGEEVGTATLVADWRIPFPLPWTISWEDQSITFTRQMDPPEPVVLVIRSIETVVHGTEPATIALFPGGAGEPAYVTNAIIAGMPQDNTFLFRWLATYDVFANDTIVDATWRFHRYVSDAEVWLQAGEFSMGQFFDFPGTYNIAWDYEIQLVSFNSGDRLGISLVSTSTSRGDGILSSWAGTEVEWQVPGVLDYNVTVEAVELRYRELIGVEVSLEATNGPEARWIESFADRIVALVDGEDTQHIQWTDTEDITDWDWEREGAGFLKLVDTRNDPIDDLQCAAPLSSDTLAIFRSRSIMRGFRTGRFEQALGVQHWLENIGTESPFSRQVTPIGVIFLGHDLMVYALTEGGIRPVGMPIHQLLVEQLTDRLEIVDSIFDPVFQHYYLAIPVNGSGICCLSYILDVNKLMQEDRIVWRIRSTRLERYGLASQL